ncbi:MAG: hypothetical protein HYV33_04425 [Candidatus Kerfeldbacteria bacterium]|nr:hypothetical protein [Candidatus Kerfeldbacteria bacterium]
MQLQRRLRDFPVFSIADIQKLAPDFHNQRLSEWQNKGYIIKIRQGYYCFTDVNFTEPDLFLIANTIYKPSYISLEMALSIYHLIPEAVYAITSVSSQKTKTFQTSLANFSYRHMKPSLLFGYELREFRNHRYMIADIEKALLDYLYFHPRCQTAADFTALRLNIIEWKKQADLDKVQKYLTAFHHTALVTRTKRLMDYLNYA